MPGVSRVNTDSAGGTIIEAKVPSVKVNGNSVAVLGCQVQGHGSSPHNAPTMIQASSSVYAGGIGICRQGDNASCGHPAIGSSNVFING
jgi:uncharacterized Zn-binding protein involved in type VI secretion